METPKMKKGAPRLSTVWSGSTSDACSQTAGATSPRPRDCWDWIGAPCGASWANIHPGTDNETGADPWISPQSIVHRDRTSDPLLATTLLHSLSRFAAIVRTTAASPFVPTQPRVPGLIELRK